MARRASASAASEFHAWPAAGRGRARASPRTAAGKRRILRVPRSPADERPPRRVPRPRRRGGRRDGPRSEEHTSELQSLAYLVCRLLLEKKKKMHIIPTTSASQPS